MLIEAEIIRDFPGLHLAVLVGKNLNNHSPQSEMVNLLREAVSQCLLEVNLGNINVLPKVISWQKAYKQFGANPKKHRSSIENLCRLAIERGSLRSINTIVDIYNVISLKHLLPVGGDDLDRVTGQIRLGYAKGQKPFLALNSQETCYPSEPEVTYSDDLNTLCRRWNWRESDLTKFTSQSKNVCLVIEALPPSTKVELVNAMQDLENLLREYCGGTYQSKILSSADSQFEF